MICQPIRLFFPIQLSSLLDSCVVQKCPRKWNESTFASLSFLACLWPWNFSFFLPSLVGKGSFGLPDSRSHLNPCSAKPCYAAFSFSFSSIYSIPFSITELIWHHHLQRNFPLFLAFFSFSLKTMPRILKTGWACQKEMLVEIPPFWRLWGEKDS